MEKKKTFGAWEVTVKDGAGRKVVSGPNDAPLPKPIDDNNEMKKEGGE